MTVSNISMVFTSQKTKTSKHMYIIMYTLSLNNQVTTVYTSLNEKESR